jgi:DNA-binding transcriptional LysR family regulator
MKLMSKIDWSELDAGLLQMLVAVLDSGSITAAAERLGVTQSAVSHLLNKLRGITGDALFVKSGRGVVATARAEALGVQARELLRDLERFARSGSFEPPGWHTTFTIAANDFQRDLLLPVFAARLRERAPNVVLRLVPSGVPSVETLRADACQLILSPRPPDGTDVMQKRLFEDRHRVFYDASCREPPKTRADYLAAEHATVVYEPPRSLDLDEHLAAEGIERRFRITVPGFSALPAFIRGTPLITTAPGLLERRTMTGLSHCRPPVPCPNISMYMIWHARYQQDPAHTWLREQLLACVPLALAEG